MREVYDIIIVGSGPAGSLLASLVAQKGYKVIILEKEQLPVYKIGESLLPSIQPFLALADMEDLLPKSDFVPKRGGTFRWGKDSDLFSFYFKDCGASDQSIKAYQVRRQEFDYQLVKEAEKKGVTIKDGCNVLDTISDDTGRINGVIYEEGSKIKRTITAKYVVDTSGHRSKLASKVGQRIFSNHYQNVALFGYYTDGEKLPAEAAGNTLFEAFEDGWCWYFPVKENLFSVGALIPKDKAGKISRADKSMALRKIIAQTIHIKKMMTKASLSQESPYNQLHVRSDFSYCHNQFWQPGLVLVGDSAAFVDVLLSSGVHLATYGAVLAARSILSYFEGNLSEASCFNEYEIRYKKEFGAFYKMLAGFYNQEKDALTYQQELRYWFAQTSACGMPKQVKEKKAKLLQVLLGKTLNNEENVLKMRSYIQQLLSCENPNRVLTTFPETPKIQSQFISSKCQLTWEVLY